MQAPDNIALFDMDGTICDYVGSMLLELEKLRGPREPFVDPFHIRDDDRYKHLWNRMDLIKADENWWANLPKLQLGLDVMEEAKRLGYFCEILTQAPRKNPAALAGKLKWILANMDENTDFTLTRNKSRHYGRVLVDDFPGYVEPWLDQRPRGLAIMPSNDYNLEFAHPQVIRYDGSNIEEVKDGLEKVLVKK